MDELEIQKFLDDYFEREPEGEKCYSDYELDLAQAVAALTEKRVLEEMRENAPFNSKYLCGCCADRMSYIDQRLAALRAGKERDGKD